MISLAHRTIFVHIRKCGGQSIEQAFLDDLGMTWKHHRHLLLLYAYPSNSNKPEPRLQPLAHLTAREYLEHDYLPRSLWNSFYRFSTVRNPYGRIESFYRWWKEAATMSFETFATRATSGYEFKRGKIYSQASYLQDRNEGILVEDIFRLEELSAGWPRIRYRTGLKGELPHRNAAKAKEPLTWTDAMREAVAKAYAVDFALFGYAPETGERVAPTVPAVRVPELAAAS